MQIKPPLRFVDLFAGLGGFHLATTQFGAECVFASEIDEHLCSIYEKNFGLKPAGDIRKIAVEDIPAHDLLCAGFPCQPFSKAGEQKGWKDAIRGTVFFNVVEILRVHRPEYVILENVAHFVRHDKGNTYLKVKTALESLGYAVDSKQFSPHQFGVPQIRERMYLVARLGGLVNYSWPIPETKGSELSLCNILDAKPHDAIRLSNQVIRCLETWQEFLQLFPENEKLPSFPIWSMEFGATYPFECDSLEEVPLRKLRRYHGSFGESLNTRFRSDIMELLPSYAQGENGVFPHWKQLFIRQNREFYEKHRGRIKRWLSKIKIFPPSLQKLEWNCQGEPRDIWQYVIQFRASGVRVKRATTSPSLVAMTTTQVPIIAWEQRYMTVHECARLQSMDGLEHLPMGTAAVAALGNAVNVKVVRLILENLIGPWVKSHVEEQLGQRLTLTQRTSVPLIAQNTSSPR